MTNFEMIKNFTVEEMVEAFATYGDDTSPWNKWMSDNYCDKCEPVMVTMKFDGRQHEANQCEIDRKCKFSETQGLGDFYNDYEAVIRAWLNAEAE